MFELYISLEHALRLLEYKTQLSIDIYGPHTEMSCWASILLSEELMADCTQLCP